jgi:N6-L-threonylcarbamoyladenine synthase
MLLTWKSPHRPSAEQLEDFNSACALVLRISCTARLGVPVYFPSPHLSTDNAAMIAAAGTVKLQAGERAGFDLNADVTLRLQNVDLEEETLRRVGVRYRL